jgi:methyl-accepting chemotaxis protein
MRLDTRSFSLRAKLVALVSALLALVALVLLAFIWPKLDSLAGRWMERHAVALAGTLGAAVAPGAEFDDATAVHELLASLEPTPDAVYARVEKGGKELSRWVRTGVTPPLAPPGLEHVARSEGMLHVRSPLHTPNGAVGTLTVGFSLDALKDEERDNLKFAALLALGIFGFGTLLAFGLGTLLGRPLRDMTAVALQIADGQLGAAQRALRGTTGLQPTALAADADVHDEASQLAIAFARMLGTLKETTGALQDSALRLSEAVQALISSTAEQRQTVGTQADAIARTAAMAQQFRQSSQLASDQAGSVLQVAERALALGRSGEQSIAATAQGLGEIRQQVEDIAGRIGDLTTGSAHIAQIAETVKDLASQSSVVALNAGIEAARAGEHGRAFAVVAHELRTLADQSGASAARVRVVLGDFAKTMRAAVEITEEGSRRIADGLGQVGRSGDRLRELSAVVTDSSNSARQIATAVDQQHQAIGHLVEATTSLSAMMDDTLRRIELTNRTAAAVEEVSRVVSQVAQRYRD